MAQNKTDNFGPVALTTVLTTNLLAPAAAGAGGVGYPVTADVVSLKRTRIVNRTGAAVTCSFWKGATGANAAGTEVIGQGLSVPANSSVDYPGTIRLEGANGFLVGGASANNALTIQGEIEIGKV